MENSKDSVLGAVEMIGGIDPVLIAEADEKSKRGGMLRWIAAAAACLALGFGIFAAARLAKKPAEELSAALPRDGAQETGTAGKKVLYSSGVSGDHIDEFEPKPGETVVSYPLASIVNGEGEYADAEEYNDCLFAVVIRIPNLLYDVYAEQEAAYRAACEDPDNVKYDEIFDYWYNGVFMNMTPEQRSEALQGHMATDDLFWEMISAHVDEYALTQMSEAEWSACKAAHENKLALVVSPEPTPETLALIAARVASEAERLSALGLDVEVSEEGGYIVGRLTKDQIAAFPANSAYGYCILWQGQDNVIDE